MKIIETNVNDINNSVDELKLNLVNRIIEKINPLFNIEYIKKVKEIKMIEEEISTKKILIKDEKIELTKISEQLEKKKREQLLINRIGKLISAGLVQESMKKEMTNLLTSFDSMDKEKINTYLSETMQIISQRFAKT
jgi:hypothetical protein